MKLTRFTFAQSEFLKLAESEQMLFATLAHVRNDIRHLNFLLITSSNSVASSVGDEKEIALHHYQHILRLLAATLHESWKIVEKGWYGAAVSRDRNRDLSDAGKEALRLMGQYFGDSNNNLHRIRNEVAFHYDLTAPSEWFKMLPEETHHHILSGTLSQNIFHLFPEVAINRSIFGFMPDDDLPTVERKVRVVGDEILRVLDLITTFSDDYFMVTMKRFRYRRDEIEVSDGLDPRNCPSVVIAANPVEGGNSGMLQKKISKPE